MLVCSDVLVVLLGCALICTAFILFSFNLAIYPPLGPSPPPPPGLEMCIGGWGPSPPNTLTKPKLLMFELFGVKPLKAQKSFYGIFKLYCKSIVAAVLFCTQVNIQTMSLHPSCIRRTFCDSKIIVHVQF